MSDIGVESTKTHIYYLGVDNCVDRGSLKIDENRRNLLIKRKLFYFSSLISFGFKLIFKKNASWIYVINNILSSELTFFHFILIQIDSIQIRYRFDQMDFNKRRDNNQINNKQSLFIYILFCIIIISYKGV